MKKIGFVATLLTFFCISCENKKQEKHGVDSFSRLSFVGKSLQKDSKVAKSQIDSVLKCGEKELTTTEKGYLYNHYSSYYIGNYDVKGATEWSDKAYKLLESIRNDTVRVAILMNKSTILLVSENMEEGYNTLMKAKEIEEKHATGNLMKIYRILGNMNIETGNLEKALFYFNKIKSLAKTDEDEISAYLGLADTYTQQKNYDKALYTSKSALSLLKNDTQKKNLLYVYGYMAKAFEGLNNPDSAIYYYQNKNNILKQKGRVDIMTQINHNINLGTLFERKNNFQNALGHFGIAKSLLMKYKKSEAMGLDTELKMLLSLKNLYVKTGNYKLAYDYGNKYQTLVDERDNKENNLKIRELEGEYNTSQKQNVINKLRTELTLKNKIVNQQYIILGVVTLLVFSMAMSFYLSVKKRRLETEKERIELEQRLLLSQMNPHFMFNALSAIQKEIVMGNTKMANIYLTKYADLTRLILENSRQQFISIEDELSVLECYLLLQKIRYTDKFDYLIEYTPELKKSFMSIPPMLIQPFIENSLEHGFEGINYKGFLKINFTRQNSQLICTIDDNGKGGQFEKVKSKNSYSTKIVGERLAFLSKQTGIKSALNFFQKQSPEFGYHVSITIPLHES